jgi:4-oxalocrotonate tautomerase
MKGLLDAGKKKELHRRLTDLMVEIEGNGNKEFAKLVLIKIDEDIPENFSMGGKQATEELVKKLRPNKNYR